MRNGVGDQQLVEEVLSGSQEAFVHLVRRYENLVLHIVTPLVGVNPDREDICQDVFLKVYEKLGTFRFRSALGTWIGRIAYNTSVNFLNRKRSVRFSDLISEAEESEVVDSLVGDFDDPEQILVRAEDADRLKTAIDGLPRLQRAVLLLFYQDELSLAEIGAVTGMPVNTIKSHLFRAKTRLRERLTQETA